MMMAASPRGDPARPTAHQRFKVQKKVWACATSSTSLAHVSTYATNYTLLWSSAAPGFEWSIHKHCVSRNWIIHFGRNYHKNYGWPSQIAINIYNQHQWRHPGCPYEYLTSQIVKSITRATPPFTVHKYCSVTNTLFVIKDRTHKLL